MKTYKNQLAHAFTLIELLIVVLIIAILAAIAVPNFLEFQVRAKVSRAMADQRNAAVAIEAYMVDNNDYPISAVYHGEAAFTGWPTDPSVNNSYYRCGKGGPIVLTTPIAYITSWFKDIFPRKDRWTSADPSCTTCQIQDYPTQYFNIEDWNTRWSSRGDFKPERDAGWKWCLASVGPGGDVYYSLPTRSTIPSYMHPYDPTNGTISNGGIMRYGPGNPQLYQ